jgi:anti-sigma regulatory factor (Ser/Thr protein kinase)
LLRSDQTFIRNTPEAPAAARRYVRETLTGVTRDVLDAVSLMVSELATNCVLHANSDFTMTIEQTGRHVRVDVADEGTGYVATRNAGPAEISGRGLSIVDRLSDTWGVTEYLDHVGKSVWFTVGIDAVVDAVVNASG